MGCPALTYHEKDDALNFLGLWKKSDGSEKSYKYYPFGLQTSSSWTRESSKDNNYLYNAANELNKTSGWYEMFYRGYDPAIGRMLQVDPMASMFASFTTYNYAINNPVTLNDPNGGQTKAPSQAPPGVSQMGWDRINRLNNRSEAGDFFYENWDEDYYARNGGGHMGAVEYRYFYSDGVEAEWKRHVEIEWIADATDDEAYLADFLKKYFRGDMRAVDLPINIKIDPNLPKGDNGWTWRSKQNTIEMRIAKSIMKDPKLLYVTLAHEFVHAIDLNPDGFYDYFDKIVKDGPDKKDIMLAMGEYHAYTVSSRLAIENGTDSTNGDSKWRQHYEDQLVIYNYIAEVNRYLGYD